MKTLLALIVITVVSIGLIASDGLKNGKSADKYNVQIEEVVIECLLLSLLDDNYIINEDEEYKALLHEAKIMPVNTPDVKMNEACRTYSLPEIDFLNKTLLGVKTMAAGCRAPYNYQRRMEVDDTNKEYTFIIEINNNLKKGEVRCDRGFTLRMDWVVVPKMTFGYSVSFKITEL